MSSFEAVQPIDPALLEQGNYDNENTIVGPGPAIVGGGSECGPSAGMVGYEALENDEQAGRFARMGSFVTNKFVELKTSTQESISNVGKTISEGVKKHPKLSGLATGMATLALVGVTANQASGETTPINQTETTPALTGEALKQFCLAEGLKAPKASSAMLNNPGSSPENQKNSGTFQVVNIIPTKVEAMPADCKGQYDRKQFLKVGIQNPQKRKSYYPITSPKWQYSNGNAKNYYEDGYVSIDTITTTFNKPKAYYYRPTPGRGVTHVQGRYKSSVEDKSTGKTYTRFGAKFPVKVEGGMR